jgi:hypothetical protein
VVEVALAARAVPAVPDLGVALGQPADEAAELAVRPRPQDQVPVVGHHAPGEQPHAGACALLTDEFGEAAVVGLVLEQRRAGVGAVEDGVDEAADIGAGCAWHGGRVAMGMKGVKSPEPFRFPKPHQS